MSTMPPTVSKYENAREHYAAVANTKNAMLRKKYKIKRNLNPPTRSIDLSRQCSV
uniref:Uncharacterized protein n=1 Tax=Amphimedon queenslandica TaxID=400682 RepID=A0A1X7VQR2_AMPQE